MINKPSALIVKNIKTLYLLGFFQSFMVVMPVFVPLLQGYGLSMSQVMQTQALFALVIALCEVPSGYIADLFGRKRAIVIGSALNAAGFAWLVFADSFVDFMIFEAILGVGFSLISGADLALLYDSELYLDKADVRGGAGASQSLSRLIAIEAAASGIAGIAASLLLLWSLPGLVAAQSFLGLIPLFLGLRLCEPPRPQSVGNHRENAGEVVKLLFFEKPVVLWSAAAITVFGLLAVYVFWLYQKYWEMNGIDVSLYGYIWAAFALTVSIAAGCAGALERRLGTRRLVLLVAALPLIGLSGMLLSGGWIGVAFGLALQIARGLSMSVFYEGLNRRVPGRFRATINSLVSMSVRVVFIVTGPAVGFLLDRYGMTSTLAVLLGVFTPLLALVLLPLLSRIWAESQSQRQAAATTQ